MKRTGLLFDQSFTKHDPGDYHPEAPGRIEAIIKQLPEGTSEMVVHPAMNSSADNAGEYTERYGLEDRASELDLLCDDRARAFLISQSIELTNFSSLKSV